MNEVGRVDKPSSLIFFLRLHWILSGSIALATCGKIYGWICFCGWMDGWTDGWMVSLFF